MTQHDIDSLKKHFNTAFPGKDADNFPADFAAYLFLQRNIQIDNAIRKLQSSRIGHHLDLATVIEMLNALKFS